MHLLSLDWIIIGIYFAVILAIGLAVARKAGQDSSEFFLSGRNMPWWLLGISMVATTFSADTPNLVTNIVRENGVAGNWAWWAFLLTGMLTVFVYARLWRRSGVLTDLEFYELRYGGQPAAFLRGFRAIYLGVIFNVLIMATVCLAAIKIGSAMLGLDPWVTILGISLITVLYSSLGGLRGVILTDFIQFALAMVGSIWAVWVILDLPEVQNLERVLTHPEVQGKLDLIPSMEDRDAWLTLLILPIAVQWWSVWYPGAEPGGGGYVAQRMLAAKGESHAVGATFLFNAAHYALRPWPWLLIALASIVVFPMRLSPPGEQMISVSPAADSFLAERVSDQDIRQLESTLETYRLRHLEDTAKAARYAFLQRLVTEQATHPEVRSLAYLAREKGKKEAWADPLAVEALVSLQLANPTLPLSKLGQDLAYPTMLRFLPPGLIGLVLASLLAAVMSTLSTHLNWGASYIVHDAYRRFIRPEASEQNLVSMGRVATLGLMILAAIIALLLSDALQSFNILLQIGAGTGLIFILRWFWWRINAWSEI
ncbi:MAG: sodium:solute symporter family protein, partial [Bacteroidota bacterium]